LIWTQIYSLVFDKVHLGKNERITANYFDTLNDFTNFEKVFSSL
jgi:hypothetical protein